MTLKFKVLLSVVIVLTAGILLIFSPLFNFQYITVSGNFQIETEEILERAGLADSANFFLFSPRRADTHIKKNLYIEQVTFRRVFPHTLEIRVQERFLSGFVEHINGMFLYIDENGRVLEVRSYKSEDLPVITGLRFSHFHLGQVLDVDNPEAFGSVVTYSRLLNRHNLVDVITQLDVSDPNNTRLRLFDIEVYLGDITNAQEKILTLREIVDVWPLVQDIRGFLDLREPGNEHILRKIT